MKNITKAAKLVISLGILQSDTAYTFFNDNFEQEFIARMNNVERSMKESEEKIQAQLKEFHNRFFNDRDAKIKDYNDYANQNSLMDNQNYMQHYQQSSSSLSFGNDDMTIKILEQKDYATSVYTIVVNEKNVNQDMAHTSADQTNQIATELKELASYIKKTFRSASAEKMLEACMHAMTEEQKDNLVSIASSTNGNERKYTIEIKHKEEPIVADLAPVKKNRKTKKTK